MATSANLNESVLHVLVVGFHHKKGCQLEYSFPPLQDGEAVDSHVVPDVWKHLPSLALPDGAHNYTSDTVYFHLPAKDGSLSTVYGVSCYRQMDASQLLKKDIEVTRNTVQKSVCVLSKLPLYGLIQAKLEMITHVYFRECDFSQVRILEDAYNQLNTQLTQDLIAGSQVFLGLPCRELIQNFKHKVLVLFKLMLLERRVLFYGSPAKSVCSSLLSILSLFPEMIEHGLKESAAYALNKQLSPTLKNVSLDSNSEDFLEVHYTNDFLDTVEAKAKQQTNTEKKVSTSNSSEIPDLLSHVLIKKDESNEFHRAEHSDKVKYGEKNSEEMEELLEKDDGDGFEGDKLTLEFNTNTENSPIHEHVHEPVHEPIHHNIHEPLKTEAPGKKESVSSISNKEKRMSRSDSHQSVSSQGSFSSVTSDLSQASSKAVSGLKNRITGILGGKEGPKVELQDMRPSSPNTLVADAFGFPLPMFTKGVLCHPYLSLQYYDLLQDPNVRGFAIGASNMLFKQKRHLLDVVVELLDDGDVRIDVADAELRRQINLTTADLRFAENLIHHVCQDQGDVFLDETEWEGGDEWLREQFRSYITSLVTTVHSQDENLLSDFHHPFIQAWKTTQNYKYWKSSCTHPGLDTVNPGHLYHGNIGIQDVRNKLSQFLFKQRFWTIFWTFFYFACSIQSSERGKKITAAAANTGKAVLSTSKAVGGALESARSVVSSSVTSWFGKIRHWTSTESEEGDAPYMPSEKPKKEDNVATDSDSITQQIDACSEKVEASAIRAKLDSIGEDDAKTKIDESNKLINEKGEGQLPHNEINIEDIIDTENCGPNGDHLSPEFVHKPTKTEI